MKRKNGGITNESPAKHENRKCTAKWSHEKQKKNFWEAAKGLAVGLTGLTTYRKAGTGLPGFGQLSSRFASRVWLSFCMLLAFHHPSSIFHHSSSSSSSSSKPERAAPLHPGRTPPHPGTYPEVRQRPPAAHFPDSAHSSPSPSILIHASIPLAVSPSVWKGRRARYHYVPVHVHISASHVPMWVSISMRKSRVLLPMMT